MTSTRLHVLLVLLVAGCSSSSPKIDGPPCDAKAIAALDASLDMANGINVDLTKAGVQAEIAAAKAKVTGTKVAFTGCMFRSQGNDEVSFGAVTGDAEISCTMKGGSDAVTTFRRKAMKIGQDKVRLDITGQIAMGGMKDFERLGLRDCEISVHD